MQRNKILIIIAGLFILTIISLLVFYLFNKNEDIPVVRDTEQPFINATSSIPESEDQNKTVITSEKKRLADEQLAKYGITATSGQAMFIYKQFGSPEVYMRLQRCPNTTDKPDRDNDCLLDQDEKFHNTDPNKVDSDNDGLLDGEEVNTYKTDPNSKDSDGDGFNDGEEVKGGYDPAGSGKLE